MKISLRKRSSLFPNSSVIAVIFDFDDTLLPDSSSALLRRYGIDTDMFWKDAQKLVSSGYDQTLAYLKLFLDNIGEEKPLGLLKSSDLQEFGSTLDSTFYSGIPAIFKDLRKIVVEKFEDIGIEFYIISGGIQDIIEGSKTVGEHFNEVYACRLSGDSPKGLLKNIMRCVTFTEKTRYVFEINKGLKPSRTIKNPNLVNRSIKLENRRIPFENMIYIGDGYTDIPCFSLISHFGGLAFGVFNPEDENSAKRTLQEFLKPDRVISMHAPKYGRKEELGSLLRTAVAQRCAKIQLERELYA